MTPQKARDILEYEFPNVSAFIEHTYARYDHRKKDGWVLEHAVSLVSADGKCERFTGKNLADCVQRALANANTQKWRRPVTADLEFSDVDCDILAGELTAQTF